MKPAPASLGAVLAILSAGSGGCGRAGSLADRKPLRHRGRRTGEGLAGRHSDTSRARSRPGGDDGHERRFPLPEPGARRLLLDARAAGFETARRSVTVALGKNSVLSVAMAIAGAAEAVTVSGEGSAVTAGRPRPARPSTAGSWTRSQRRGIPGQSFGRSPECSSRT